jgi:hypothetical protein
MAGMGFTTVGSSSLSVMAIVADSTVKPSAAPSTTMVSSYSGMSSSGGVSVRTPLPEVCSAETVIVGMEAV